MLARIPRYTTSRLSYLGRTYNQIALVDHRERSTERIHPEAVRLHWISERNMARNALIEAIPAEDTERGCEATFQIISLLVLVFEDGWAWPSDVALGGDVGFDAGFVWDLAVVHGDGVAVGVCCVWCHGVVIQESYWSRCDGS